MSIIGSDPLAFLTSQGGVVATPLTEAGASGAENLDSQQRSAIIGEPIPIVFCRRVGAIGGVLISPPATEARFEDNVSSDITASYHLVLSEGQIDSIQVRDVFQRSCRIGTFTQTYDRRAGTFVPGNFIDNTPDLEAPYYCGTSGTYAGLSTMAFSVTIPAGFDYWNRQIHCFVRGGIRVPRLLDGITGPSNNVVDLLLYLLRSSSRVPEAMIDTTSFLAAATFTNANGFWFNGVINESTNLRDWVGNTLKYFLLRQTRAGGKEALKPLLQINANGSIKTTPVSWAFTFTESHIVPDSFGIIYSPLADRKPFCATVLWRQQDDLGIPVMRSTEVRYVDTAEDGPYEQHDLSSFCSSENHAVKIGAYILSKRRHVSHRLQIAVKPDSFNPTLATGDLVRVRLVRSASSGAASLHDYLYEVDRIGKSVTGEIALDLTHFPVDSDLVSIVAQEVNAATGSGLLLPTGLTGVTCDINSNSDTSIPPETGIDGTFPDFDADIPDFGGGGGSGDLSDGGLGGLDGSGELIANGGLSGGGLRGGDQNGFGGGESDNPGDSAADEGGGGDGGEVPIDGTPEPGNELSHSVGCPDAETKWTQTDPATGQSTVVSEGIGATYTPDSTALNKTVKAESRCKDPSSKDGKGPVIASFPVKITDGFIPFSTGTTVNVIASSYNYSSQKLDCNTGAVANAESFSSNVSTFSVPNVVSYKVLPRVAETFYVCGGGNNTITKDYGVMLKQADGTLSLIGATNPNGGTIGTAGVSGVNRSYYQAILTYGPALTLYETPPIPDPPNPPQAPL